MSDVTQVIGEEFVSAVRRAQDDNGVYDIGCARPPEEFASTSRKGFRQRLNKD